MATAKKAAKKAVKKAAVKKAVKKAVVKKAAAKRKPNAAFMKAMTPSAALAAIVGANPLRFLVRQCLVSDSPGDRHRTVPTLYAVYQHRSPVR